MLAFTSDSINRIHQGQEIELPVRLPVLEPRRVNPRLRITGAFGTTGYGTNDRRTTEMSRR